MASNPDYKSLGDVIGMPDDQDKTFIRGLILAYEKERPGWIKHTIDEARREQQAVNGPITKRTDFGLVDGHSARRHIFELPQGLVETIETYYPTMFREKKHFQWFVKHFKELMVPEKY